MGTNFYLMSKNKESVKKHFGNYSTGDNYCIVDEPYLGYQIHICKRSCGWRPLFQKHDCFDTFSKLEDFYKNNFEDYQIYDEYSNPYNFEKFKQEMIEHSNVEPKPVKWVYEHNPIFDSDGRKSLYVKDCDVTEADLYTPFKHAEYAETEREAIKKFNVNPSFFYGGEYFADSDYNFDWVNGEFS